MRLLKTGFAALCIISLTASCASYHTCPAYAQKPAMHEQQTTAQVQTVPVTQRETRSL